MANKRVSSENLIKLQVWVTPTQKKYLESLDLGVSRTVRQLIDSHKSLSDMNLKRLYQQKKEFETGLASIVNNIKIYEEEIREESERKNDFEIIKKRALEVLVKLFTEHRGDFTKFKAPLNLWAEALQISPADLQVLVIGAARIKEE